MVRCGETTLERPDTVVLCQSSRSFEANVEHQMIIPLMRLLNFPFLQQLIMRDYTKPISLIPTIITAFDISLRHVQDACGRITQL